MFDQKVGHEGESGKPCIYFGRYRFDSMLETYVKMFVTIKKDKFKRGYVGSESRSLGQILKIMSTLEGIVLIQSA